MLDGIVPPLIVLVAAAVLLVLRRLYARNRARALRADAVVTIGLVVLVAGLQLSMGRPLAYQKGPSGSGSGMSTATRTHSRFSIPIPSRMSFTERCSTD
jgi:hypothetical protein